MTLTQGHCRHCLAATEGGDFVCDRCERTARADPERIARENLLRWARFAGEYTHEHVAAGRAEAARRTAWSAAHSAHRAGVLS